MPRPFLTAEWRNLFPATYAVPRPLGGRDCIRAWNWVHMHAGPSSLLRLSTRREEVAALLAYVCRPLASATNGAALRVDGDVLRSVV